MPTRSRAKSAANDSDVEGDDGKPLLPRLPTTPVAAAAAAAAAGVKQNGAGAGGGAVAAVESAAKSSFRPSLGSYVQDPTMAFVVLCYALPVFFIKGTALSFFTQPLV